MKTAALYVLLLISLVYATEGYLQAIYGLKIRPEYTKCYSDGTMRIYYGRLGYGFLYVSWSGGSVQCRTIQFIKSYGKVKGWFDRCELPGHSGTFTIQFQPNVLPPLCNKYYDSVTYTNCRKTSHPCLKAK